MAAAESPPPPPVIVEVTDENVVEEDTELSQEPTIRNAKVESEIEAEGSHAHTAENTASSTPVTSVQSESILDIY